MLDVLTSHVQLGHYVDVLMTKPGKAVIHEFTRKLVAQHDARNEQQGPSTATPEKPESKERQNVAFEERAAVALAAFNAFLQANVTGPILEGAEHLEGLFIHALGPLELQDQNDTASSGRKTSHMNISTLRRLCFRYLEVDGVTSYPHIPYIELFCLARSVLLDVSADHPSYKLPVQNPGKGRRKEQLESPSLRWLTLRAHTWHYKLLTQPSLGPGSAFQRSAQWSDVPTLRETIEGSISSVEAEVFGTAAENDNRQERVLFLVEITGVWALLGHDKKAKETLLRAAKESGFVYAMSGALGKRTRWQESSLSQLVVLARSNAGSSPTQDRDTQDKEHSRPKAVKLNDDTLLEEVHFTQDAEASAGSDNGITKLPDVLRDLQPHEQPQLDPLDEIILLAEATLKDGFSPADSLTSEEILPFAVRVLADKSTNWQIYTQALLVRSRIEVHRSRTVERGVLQLQAVVDQVIVDTTTGDSGSGENAEKGQQISVPAIQVTTPTEEVSMKAEPAIITKPTSFFPAASHSATTALAHVRLQYVHALNSTPRWHLESELAYSWAGVGSLVSALEIFKRLRLWAEVALCLASSASADDADGRGSGGEEKAKAILRWRLFRRTSTNTTSNPSHDQGGQCLEGDVEGDQNTDENVDLDGLKSQDFQGPEHTPPPPNAPRLLCILGDIENDPEHYRKAWEISQRRFARAQKSLGEYHLQRKEWVEARDAYQQAVHVNRLSSEMWNRLGDINLRLGDFEAAAESFRRAIAAANDVVGGEDARTWSNLGSALYSLYVERVKASKDKQGDAVASQEDEDLAGGEDEDGTVQKSRSSMDQDPTTLLSQSLVAYRQGATIANDNWRIWDNVITLGARLRPPAIQDILLALNHVISIRKSEEALDVDVLRLLLNESVLSKSKDSNNEAIYVPPRGSVEHNICELVEKSIVPLITTRSDLWELVARERVWRRDFAGAVEAAERAWRAAMGGVAGVSGGGGSLIPSSGSGSARKSWLEDREAWTTVVDRTDELVSILENYGPDVPEIGTRWKGKARSAVRSVMGKSKEVWEGSEGWVRLEGLMEGFR
jgi:tetratricopeptide (TPR) repeat protein